MQETQPKGTFWQHWDIGLLPALPVSHCRQVLPAFPSRRGGWGALCSRATLQGGHSAHTVLLLQFLSNVFLSSARRGDEDRK